jgi:uncharacterized protein (TIGR03435 family)
MRMKQISALAVLVAIRAAHAQPSSGDPSLRFEVASLKPAPPDAEPGVIHPAQGGERYVADHASLRTFLVTAFRIKADQISGGPGWVDTSLFDMDAKAEKPSSIQDLHTMLKNLLADRCQLRLHFETKERPVYVLTVDRKVKGLTPHPAGSAGDPTIGRSREKPLHLKLTMTSASMDYFAYGLTTILDRPVIDKTGLTDAYDFTLTYTEELPPGISPDRIVNGVPLDTSGPSVFEALRDQLGLRLEPRTGPVQMLVIDHVEKPSAN